MSNSDTDILRLLMEYRTAIYSYILAITRDAHSSEDVFQETSMIIWEKRASYQPGTSFKAWSREIARRTILARRRKDSKFPALLSESEMKLLGEGFNEAEKEFQPEEYVDALKQCTGELRQKDRHIIDLRYAKEFSMQQISEVLGIQAESVRKFLFRIRKTLKICVQSRLEKEFYRASD